MFKLPGVSSGVGMSHNKGGDGNATRPDASFSHTDSHLTGICQVQE